MGLGLNFVVGYAGLLDLGYVAFFAAGAYVAGWLGSQQFAQVTVNVGGTAFPGATGIHLNPWLVILIAALFAALLGVLIGIPTLRLRGDYLAIVTLGFGEIIPQFVRNGDNLGGFNLTNGSFGLNGIDGLGFGGLHGVFAFLPANFLNEADSTWYYWSALLLLAIAIGVVDPAPRQPPRPRLGRDPRGRGRRGRDGRAADAHQDARLHDRRVLRRRRRAA